MKNSYGAALCGPWGRPFIILMRDELEYGNVALVYQEGGKP